MDPGQPSQSHGSLNTQQQQQQQQMPAAWPIYLPSVDYDPADRRAILVAELLGALTTHDGWQLARRLRSYLSQQYVLPLDYQALLQLAAGSPDLEAAMEAEPAEALACVGVAVHEVALGSARSVLGLACMLHAGARMHRTATKLTRNPRPRAAPGALRRPPAAQRAAGGRGAGPRPRGGAAPQLRGLGPPHAPAQVAVDR
jgi:hypothetical protein